MICEASSFSTFFLVKRIIFAQEAKKLKIICESRKFEKQNFARRTSPQQQITKRGECEFIKFM